MCHLVLALNAHPDLPFALCSNRDEFSDRPFTDPAAHAGGGVYSVDTRSRGTWLGVHAVAGHFAALTNIGGRGGRGGVSRGALTRAFIESPARAEALLRGPAVYRYKGFNLLWSADIRAARPTVHYVTNCDPDDRARGGSPRVHELRADDDAGLIVGLGNDLLGDEHVKSPRVEAHTRAVLRRAPVAAADEPALPPARIDALRDALVEVFCERTLDGAPRGATLEKFLRWSRRRRLQPGARTALVAAPALWLIAASARRAAPTRLLAALLGLGMGYAHHRRMQHLFVDVPAGARRWTTVAQTVVLVDRHGVIHFHQRRTLAGPARAGPWSRFRLRPPG
ncbi:MAG: NRDE family protein [Myxococcales bacterium]|nr:NRDE family protein [Myxococcales bacterium]